MQILYLGEESPFAPDLPASGNQLRVDRLRRALEAHGLSSTHRWQARWDADQVSRLISELRPDCLLLAYWQLAEQLPAECNLPVVVDCIAPRPLEAHFADPLATPHYIQRYLAALARADLILTGNARQRTLHVAWLLAAGHDLRDQVPVIEVPLPVQAPTSTRSEFGKPLIAASGGRPWPWRSADTWLEQLISDDLSGRVELHHFGTDTAGEGIRAHALTSWRDWQDFLANRAGIGVELADRNIERELAQPFRIASYLEAGLPLLINDYLPIAGRVRELDAGWPVASIEQARTALRTALEQPELWRRKAAGARLLAEQDFNAKTCLAPLLRWLEAPRKRAALEPAAAPAITSRAMERKPSLIGMATRALLSPLRRQVEGRGVVIISRSDLFPADHGAAVKILETARGLADCNRPVAVVTSELSSYWLVEDGQFQSHPLPLWLRVLALPRFISHLIHRLRGLPASNAFLYWPLYDPGYGLRAAWVGRRIGATTALAEFPAYAQSARICRLLNGGHAVLAEHNVEYLRLAEQIDRLSDRAFEKFKRSELKLANCMDAVVCVSDRDRQQLIQDGLDPANLITIPHGVDLAAFQNIAPADLVATYGLDPDRPVLVYHGTFSYPPNRQALLLIVDELLPRLAKLGHPVQILAIGSEPPAALQHHDLCLTGSLDNLAAPLKACDLAIVPLVSGGGTRMKILDYFAANLAVISTSKGCEGLPVKDGRELLIRDDLDDFAAAIVDLLSNDPRRKALAQAGGRLASGLSWPQIAARYDRLFERLSR